MTKENKIKITLFIIVIILIVSSFLINRIIFIRPVFFLIALLLIIIINIMGRKNKILRSMITFLVTLFLLVILDNLVVVTFKMIPVFSYNIINYEDIRVYNGIGVRVWQCNKNNYSNLLVDPFYKNGYMCDADDSEAVDANSFLNSVIENYDEYKNKYIKINGKISKKTSLSFIEMQPYEESSIKVNGYVTFADNITLRILFNEENEILGNYDVYDDIIVVGQIKNMEKEGKNYVIYMSDSKVVSDVSLDEYTLTVTPSTTCRDDKSIFKSDNLNVYSHCIEDIIIDYGEKKYELSSALSSGKVKIDELYESPDNKDTNDDGDTLYMNDTYNVIVCNSLNSNDVIIGDSDMKFGDVVCERKVVE